MVHAKKKKEEKTAEVQHTRFHLFPSIEPTLLFFFFSEKKKKSKLILLSLLLCFSSVVFLPFCYVSKLCCFLFFFFSIAGLHNNNKEKGEVEAPEKIRPKAGRRYNLTCFLVASFSAQCLAFSKMRVYMLVFACSFFFFSHLSINVQIQPLLLLAVEVLASRSFL